MCRVRLSSNQEGLIPSERVVTIETAAGAKEEVAVDSTQIKGDSLQVALIGEEKGKALIELPRESASGRRRLWVKRETLIGGIAIAAAQR